MAKKFVLDNFSDEEFIEIVNTSFSISEVTKRCGFKTYTSGGGRKSVVKRIEFLKIDTSHFKANGRQHEKPSYKKIVDYNNVLQKDSIISRVTVRDIVIREHLLEYRCSECGNNGTWNGMELTLQLHHKDGDHTNNEIANLTFLCPNCHSQTPNYGIKNVQNNSDKKLYCTCCGSEISKDTRTGKCRDCLSKSEKINMPTKEELVDIIKKIKIKKQICFHYGISDGLLGKWLIFYSLPTHISELHKYIKDNNL